MGTGMKEKVLVDFHIRCEPRLRTYYTTTMEQQAKIADEWCQDFQEFVRDHRSQDAVEMTVHREYEDRCSVCGYLWEEDDDGLPLCCGAAQDAFLEASEATND